MLLRSAAALLAAAVLVIPSLRSPATVRPPARQWAASYDRGRRHVELVGTGPLRLTGAGRVTNLIVSSRTDEAGLLLQRLAELHARLKPGQYPEGATVGDQLDLAFSWTNGFWPGALWQAAALAPTPAGRTLFARWALSATLVHLGFETTPTHDVGFMYGESSLAGWNALCTRHPEIQVSARTCARLRASVLEAAGELLRLAKTDPGSGTIPTDAVSRYGETIVDSMMNIQILPWATEQTGERRYADLARHQADVITRLLVRADGSTTQAVHFDRRTGRIVFLGTHQGLSNTSTWARGEGWALYGFAALAEQLRDPTYLKTATRIAGYVATHLPAAAIPRWDYDAPPGAPIDVSAGVITAAGLDHLAAACAQQAGVCPSPQTYKALARRMLSAALGKLYTRPPIGLLPDQISNERNRGCGCNGGELIYGLTYALEALNL